jgi:hypothetical protein
LSSSHLNQLYHAPSSLPFHHVECSRNNADLLRSGFLPDQREAVKKRSERHLKEVCFCRQCKQEKEIRGAWCWRDPNRIHYIGQGVQHGTPGVWGYGENDGAAQWYCAVPSDGNNKGKYRCPKSTVDMKVIVRVIHGLTILVTLTAPWVSRSSNPDFGCTIVLETFRELEKRTSDGRLPKRWYVTSTTQQSLLTICYSGQSILMLATGIGLTQRFSSTAILWSKMCSMKLSSPGNQSLALVCTLVPDCRGYIVYICMEDTVCPVM